MASVTKASRNCDLQSIQSDNFENGKEKGQLGEISYVTNPQTTTKICAQVPGRNSKAFAPSSNTRINKNFFIPGTQ